MKHLHQKGIKYQVSYSKVVYKYIYYNYDYISILRFRKKAKQGKNNEDNVG